MARQHRRNVPGGIYHVMLRGNDQQNIFLGSEDRCHMYFLLQEGAERFDYRVHAFCFMNNHVHLVIQIGLCTLSRVMQNLSFRYTQWFNFRHQRSGHLFQGRFKSVLVDTDTYLIELVRYVHLNPVRAGLVTEPETWLWGGHRAYLGYEDIPWLYKGQVLGHFGSDYARACERYAEFVAAGTETAGEFLHGETTADMATTSEDKFLRRVLGDESAEQRRVVAGLPELIELVCLVYQVSVEDLLARNRRRIPSEVRALIAFLVVHLRITTLTETARFFGRDVATISGAARKMERRLQTDGIMKGRVDELIEQLTENTKPKPDPNVDMWI